MPLYITTMPQFVGENALKPSERKRLFLLRIILMHSMWNESLILIRLTRATNLLEKIHTTLSEVFSLWHFRLRFNGNQDEHGGGGGGDNLDIARVKASEKEDENSFGVKFLLGLLKCPNQVLAHAAIKALVALSEFLRKTRRDLWPSFLLALWKDAQCWVASPDPSGLKKVQAYEKAFLQNGKSDFNSRAHQDACLIATSNTLQTLQQSLKRCLKSSDEKIETKLLPRNYVESLEIFLCLLTTTVSRVANAICMAEDEGVEEQKKEPCSDHFIHGLSRELVLGSLLRLLCTTASIPPLIFDPKKLDDVSAGAYLDMLQDLIPNISRFALPPHKNCKGRTCISSYLRHKLLMVMLKLSEWFNCKPSLASSCYTALRHHGSDLLEFSLQMRNEEITSSDESPFTESLLVSSKTGTPALSSIRHMQRLSLLLLFKIADTAQPSADADRTSTSVQKRVILPAKRSREQLSPQCTCELPSALCLRDWIKRQYPRGLCGHTEGMLSHNGICWWVNKLATALVQLYIEEDDLLFIMMTQLLNMPFLSSIFMCPKHPTENMICRIVVEAFLPSRLFHAFLAAIRFDHSTIEKLLISRTSGVLCLTYLMRLLHHVSDSWPEFVRRSPCAVSRDHSHELNDCRIKTLSVRCTLCSDEDVCSHRVEASDEEVIQEYVTLRTNPHENVDGTSGASHSIDATNQADHLYLVIFKESECLERLKLRIEDLHAHALFPYKPIPLLNRLGIVVDYLKSNR